ncbi:MAG: hypothetical protein ACREDR_33675 [Blastocatellia bacterium]
MSSNYPPNQPPSGGYPPQGNQSTQGGQNPQASQGPQGGYPQGSGNPQAGYPQQGGYPTQPAGQYQYPGQGGYPQGGGVPPQKKGGKTWLWVLGGCGTLIILCVVGFFAVSYFVYYKAKTAVKEAGIDPELIQKKPALAAAKAVVAVDPDLELVSSDDDKGTLTIRNKKTGETITVNADDINKGKVTFTKDGKEVGSIEVKSDKDSGSLELKSDQGSAKFGTGIADKLPSWLPAYPGSNIQWNASINAADGAHTGDFHFSTNDSANTVADFYSDAFKKAGLSVTTTTATGQTGTGTFVTGSDQASKRSCSVTIAADPHSGLVVNVIFGDKQ